MVSSLHIHCIACVMFVYLIDNNVKMVLDMSYILLTYNHGNYEKSNGSKEYSSIALLTGVD